MQQKSKLPFIVGGVVVVGVAVYFLTKKKGDSSVTVVTRDTGGDAIPPVPGQPAKKSVFDLLKDIFKGISTKTPPISGTVALGTKSLDTKVLQQGLASDADVKTLQHYLNNLTAKRKANTAVRQVIFRELSENGNFNSDTKLALNGYMGKDTITVGELKVKIINNAASNAYQV